jgi:RNA polymerase sigma-70 factor (ECF subfamily)
MTEAETTLVTSAQAGDRAAFEELVRRTSRLIFARLYLETGDTHRAEDLLQETLLSAFRSLKGLAQPSAFRPWLLRIAQNVAIDSARREVRQRRFGAGSPAVLPTVPATEPAPMEQAAHEELRHKVLSVLRSLPEEYRLPLTLRYITGADYETIQSQLGLTNGSLRGLLQRGLKLLRDQLPRDFDDRGQARCEQ